MFLTLSFNTCGPLVSISTQIIKLVPPKKRKESNQKYYARSDLDWIDYETHLSKFKKGNQIEREAWRTYYRGIGEYQDVSRLCIFLFNNHKLNLLVKENREKMPIYGPWSTEVSYEPSSFYYRMTKLNGRNETFLSSNHLTSTEFFQLCYSGFRQHEIYGEDN